MSVNIHLIARRISDDTVVFEDTLTRAESTWMWETLQIDIGFYPDGTGSVFRDMPGHLAATFLSALENSPPIVTAFRVVLQRSNDLNATIIWS